MSAYQQRILIFVVTYNADRHIVDTLDRIDRKWLQSITYEILIIDDASHDDTYDQCAAYISRHPDLVITLEQNRENLGYGGNQKLGYTYALEHHFDLVVLLHGDGQYAPEYLDQMVNPIIIDQADVVLGSRMLDKSAALKGNMPMYKWIGNQVLTSIQNLLLGTRLAEFHTGYRAFSVSALRKIPYGKNSDYFDFDTEIIIQLWDTKSRFTEVSIPTFYGDEISYVNGFKYAALILWTTLKSRWVKHGWLKDPRFEYGA